jgi:hypothetical protein
MTPEYCGHSRGPGPLDPYPSRGTVASHPHSAASPLAETRRGHAVPMASPVHPSV